MSDSASLAKQEKLLLRASEAAALAGGSRSWWDSLVIRGLAPRPIRVGSGRRGGQPFWRRTDIELWIELDCPDAKTFEAIKESREKKRK